MSSFFTPTCRRLLCLLATLASVGLSPGEVTTEIIGSPQFYIDELSAVQGVPDKEQSLYQAQLAGEFGVRISGLTPGVYKIVVGNAELSSSAKGFRSFNITANGKTAVEGLNLNSQFGFAKKGDVSFETPAQDGAIQINFVRDPNHDQPRMSFVRVYDPNGKLVAQETALARRPKNWSASKRVVSLLPSMPQIIPKENPAKTFSEMKIYDASGHPWRVAQEDWEGARLRVKTEAGWSEWLAKQRAVVDQWMVRHPTDRVAWVCGWYHDFVSPKDASFLTWSDQIPGEEVSYLHSPSDPKVEITPTIMGGWVLHFRYRHASMMRQAAQLYRLTGEEKYAAWAANQLDFYTAHFHEWPDDSQRPGWRAGARLYWQTLDEATNLIVYTECARLLGDYVTPERKQAWKEKFFYPEAEMLNRTFRDVHNIAMWHRSAVAQVALLYRDDALWKSALDGEFGVRRLLATGVTSDYIWWEHSFGYSNYLLEATLSLFRNAGLQGRAPELANEMEIVENLLFSLLYLRFPDGTLPMPADATLPERAPNEALFTSSYRIFPTVLGARKAAGLYNWDTLVDPPKAVSTAPSLPEVKTHNLESTRMALLKSGPWQVFVHYGQLTSSHAQAEALNFSAYYKETDVTHDPGTVGYGSPLHAGYYTRGLCQNVPLVDGEGENILPQKGVVNEFSDSPPRLSVTQPNYRTDASASRNIRIEEDKLVDVVTLTIKDGAARNLGLPLHLQGKVQLPAGFKTDPKFVENHPEPFKYWTEVKRAEFKDRATFEVKYGDVRLQVTLQLSGPFTIWHASVPDMPPKRREVLFIETTGPKAVFTTTFAPLNP